jgi:hypothetical protein
MERHTVFDWLRHTVFDWLRRTVIGSPLPTSASHEERYGNAEALAILSSDALSSVAYATQEIVLILGMAGGRCPQFHPADHGPDRATDVDRWH